MRKRKEVCTRGNQGRCEDESKRNRKLEKKYNRKKEWKKE